MNFGILLVIRNPQPWHRPDHDVYQGYLDNAVRGEDLGFSHIWTSEHHFTIDGWSPAQLPILANLAARTKNIRLGTYILVMPLHNPIRVAEDVATVDILSNGRMDLAVGPGWNMVEYSTFAVPYMQRRGRMYEGLEIVRRCFTEEEFSFKGKYYEFNNVRMTTKPVQKPFPFWVAAMGDKAIVEAGTHGYHLAGGGAPEKINLYNDALRKAGRNPGDYQRAELKICHVAETTEKAWDEAEPHIHFYMSWFFSMLKEQNANNPDSMQAGDIPSLGELRKTGKGPYGPAFVGSVEDVTRMFEELRKVNPVTEVIPTVGLPGMDPRVARHSMELIAKEMIPHFRNK